jgi:hypothetical protein
MNAHPHHSTTTRYAPNSPPNRILGASRLALSTDIVWYEINAVARLMTAPRCTSIKFDYYGYNTIVHIRDTRKRAYPSIECEYAHVQINVIGVPDSCIINAQTGDHYPVMVSVWALATIPQRSTTGETDVAPTCSLPLVDGCIEFRAALPIRYLGVRMLI